MDRITFDKQSLQLWFLIAVLGMVLAIIGWVQFLG
jgi:hypothetical protein